jgi:hypothetical protein
MEVKFATGTKRFRLEDVYRYQEYPGTDNRWSERAFLFRDGSILWEMMGFSTYAEDGSLFSTGGFVHQNGAHHLPCRINGEYPIGIDNLVQKIKEKGTQITIAFSQVWELYSWEEEPIRI